MAAGIIVCFNMTKGIRKHGVSFSNIHDKKLFFGYFTLGGSGSPEKDWGFVLLLFGDCLLFLG